jgi:hypothetical protein
MIWYNNIMDVHFATNGLFKRRVILLGAQELTIIQNTRASIGYVDFGDRAHKVLPIIFQKEH